MRNPLEKRLFWISVGLHIFVLAIIAFSHQDSRIKKTFLAYGRHSKRILHAYFRQLKSPINTSQKYLQARRAKNRKAEACRAEARKAKARKANKKKNKKPVKKRVFKKKQNKIVKNKLVKKTPKKVPKPEKLETEKPDEVVEEVLDFNLMGEKDPKMILCQRCIQSEVDRVWKPPIGVEKGTECVVHFVINRDGCVKNCKIIKSSNVLIYDLSIVQVTKKFAFDKCLWGKSFDINFRQ